MLNAQKYMESRTLLAEGHRPEDDFHGGFLGRNHTVADTSADAVPLWVVEAYC